MGLALLTICILTFIILLPAIASVDASGLEGRATSHSKRVDDDRKREKEERRFTSREEQARFNRVQAQMDEQEASRAFRESIQEKIEKVEVVQQRQVIRGKDIGAVTRRIAYSSELTKRQRHELIAKKNDPPGSGLPRIAMSDRDLPGADQVIEVELYEEVFIPEYKDGEEGLIILEHTGKVKRVFYGEGEQYEWKDDEIAPYGLIETGADFVARVERVKKNLAAQTLKNSELVPTISHPHDTIEKLFHRRDPPPVIPQPPVVKKPPKKTAKEAGLIPFELDPSEFRFSEQCFLMHHINLLNKKLKQTWFDQATPTFYNLMGSPVEVKKRFRDKASHKPLFSLKPYQLSLLVPKIKIYKIQYSDEAAFKSRNGKQIELRFKDFVEEQMVEQITGDIYGRGDSAGLKAFNYSYDGKHPGEAKTIINGTMELHFQNFASLVGGSRSVDNYSKRQAAEDAATANFIDLIWASPSKISTAEGRCNDEGTATSKTYNPQYFEIKVVVGWATPDDPEGKLFNTEERAAIEESSEVLFLSLRDHNFSFNQNGTIDLTINYIGRTEAFLKSDESDLFAPNEIAGCDASASIKGLKEELDALNDKIKRKNKRPQTGPRDEEIKKLEEERKEIRKRKKQANFISRADQYSTFMRKLRNRTYYIDLDAKLMARHVAVANNEELSKHSGLKDPASKGEYLRALAQELTIRVPDLDPTKNNSKNAVSSIDRIIKEGKKSGGIGDKDRRAELKDMMTATHPKDPRKARVNFFFLGDLVRIVTESIPTNINTGIVLGPLELVSRTGATSSKRHTIPLANVPISMNLFHAWFVENVLKYDKRTYRVGQFITDIIQSLIIPATGAKCTGGDSGSVAKLLGESISVPDSLSRWCVKNAAGSPTNLILINEMPSLSSFHHKESKAWHHYLLLSATQRYHSNLNGDRHADFDNGIYHLNLGQDSGIVQEINFTKNDIPFLQEQFITQNMEIGQIQRLYNADVKLFGSSCFDLGQLVYLNPNLPGLGSPKSPNHWAGSLGIGGYYLIVNLQHSLGVNGYQTNMKCTPEHVFIKRERDKCERVSEHYDLPADIGGGRVRVTIKKVNKP